MNQTTFLDNVIDERQQLELIPPDKFDSFLSNGWRLLGQSMVRHNFSICRGEICHTVPLRIRLDDFEPSKGQRQILRRGAPLLVKRSAIRLSQEKYLLFGRHVQRLHERQPASLISFLNPYSAKVPVKGQEFRVYLDKEMVACSFFHLGNEAVSGTYCIFDPFYGQFSLGTYTMLLELLLAKELGKKYYYHGYVYNVPSQFDYKLNFTAMERFDWQSGAWKPQERVAVRRWTELIPPPA